MSSAPFPRVLPILEYHAIATKAEGPRFSRACVPPEAFARQVRWLAAHGYEAVTLARAVGNPADLPARPVVFTFDDGYLDCFTAARPLLDTQGWRGTVFCCPGLIDPDQPRVHEPWGAPLMSRAQLKTLAEDGWDLGGHTWSHPRLPDLSADAQREEIRRGKEALEAITGTPVTTFAYPEGRFDATTALLVEEAAFTCAVTTAKGNRHRPGDRYALRRVFMRPDTQERILAHRLAWTYDAWHRLRQTLGWEAVSP